MEMEMEMEMGNITSLLTMSWAEGTVSTVIQIQTLVNALGGP